MFQRGNYRVRVGWLNGVLLALIALQMIGGQAIAHEGPPYPIMMDEAHGPFLVSIWADPDIGDALFYVMIESKADPSAKVNAEVSLWTKPKNNRLEKVSYQAEQQPLRGRTQFVIKPYFDEQDMWDIGVALTADGQSTEVDFEIESTPDGYGAWDLLIYIFPFAFLGGLWIKAMLTKRPIEEDEVIGESDDVSDHTESTVQEIKAN